MVPDLTELTQGHLESRTRHHWGEGQSGAFGVRRAILGRYKVEWERIGGAPNPSSQGSGKASWRMRPKRWVGVGETKVELKREIGRVFYTERGACTNTWRQ